MGRPNLVGEKVNMTYIIGLKSNGINSIISDARVTYEHGSKKWGTNTYLKTGELFPGCIFGMVGNYDFSKKFILSAKKHFATTPQNTVQGFWRMFEQFVSNYNFPTGKNDHFQILLSTRAFGNPKFYLLDTRKSEVLSSCDKDWIKLGSGKKLLDERIDKDYKVRLDAIHNFPSVKGQPNENLVDPYLMCLWLTELSQSFERQKLEDNYVGGVFHFIFQTTSSNHAQLPSVYVLLDVNKKHKRINLWYYRVCFVHPWLVIDTCIPPGQLGFPKGKQDRIALLADTALPPKKNGSWSKNELVADLKAKLVNELDKQPFYFFCGFGYKDISLRKKFLFQLNPEGDCVFSHEGVIRADMIKLLLDELK